MKPKARYHSAFEHYTTTQNAINILAGARDGLVTTRQIAERSGLSQQLIFKIVSRLVRAGLLTSRRGASGGIRLGRSLKEITIAEVVHAVAPNQKKGTGFDEFPIFDEAAMAFVGVLKDYSVADAMRVPERERSPATRRTAKAKPKVKRKFRPRVEPRKRSQPRAT